MNTVNLLIGFWSSVLLPLPPVLQSKSNETALPDENHFSD
jgi:hypothetical protein